ncbi:MAG: ComEC/Rec2 family competence protein, partial [Fusobacteriaceae bacterium]
KEYEISEIEKISKIEKNLPEKLLEARADKILKNSSYAQKNLFKGVVLGIKEPVSKRIKNLFINTGTAHLLAISGLHIGIILFILSQGLTKLKIGKRNKNIIILVVITFYFYGIRSSPSVERAYMMAAILLLGNIFYENYSMKKSLALSFIISLLINPVSYRDISFVFSYSAMLGIIICSKPLNKFNMFLIKKIKSKYIKLILNYIAFTISLQLFMAPVIYYYFEKFSFLTIIFSLILTPIGSIYIFLCFVSLLFPTIFLANLCYNILIKIMEMLLGI